MNIEKIIAGVIMTEGISQAEVARRIGISRQLLNAHLQDETIPWSAPTAKLVADFLAGGKIKRQREIFISLMQI